MLIDLALEEDLQTRFRIVLANDDEDEVAELLQDERTVLGLSDAGAHASQLCDACFSTHLLGHWVREQGVLTLEQAVWRLTGHAAAGVPPARTAACIARGSRRRPRRLRPRHRRRRAAWSGCSTCPAGADRLIARSRGIEHVWVNGTAIRSDGKDIDDARPGVLMRGGTA